MKHIVFISNRFYIFPVACNDTSSTMDKWLSKLESSGWLTNVSSVLNCAALIAQSLVQVQRTFLLAAR